MSWEPQSIGVLPVAPRDQAWTRCQNVLAVGRCEGRARVVYERRDTGQVISLCAHCRKALGGTVRRLYEI